ncbi:hypothetical protein ACH4UM_23960 [Streptomyces sp. NPDC020801]|uniref:hypothetical protein n=1 Tax=Streptomyces sp. NPDC020801 TaxID=3365093 RepID=UPI0037A88F2D
MGQQVSPDAALAAFRKRCGELGDEIVLLRAYIEGLEAENEQLKAAQQAPAADVGQQVAPGQPHGGADAPV